ncbi:dTDP-6-deoxy-L-talose 4-dehydrogenase [NAD(P)+] [Lipingzhangella halophila]|uniref:dTDP-6-deoxy-L-talose 4-dehydrogenase [NAD(P)+] n=1 Tax=Lipingzhangella halophila TaxID=1783352 RepID=A0A7W7RLA5_9ACTN|nr:NAD(P)-dependent oxidoreductase [Lipingzhangella halophila]MBB4934074.1 dTDP-6-deoxy-L-talose 4-dehydrogenase [NAD(P)+] [Lipingzhangella halophila]
MKGTRVLVTGGTGFLGRRVCADLAAAGAEVAVVARRAPPRGFPHRFLALDLSTAGVADVVALLERERPDVVVNATGSIWGLDDQRMRAMCTTPVLLLVEALAALGRGTRLVHLGTVLEYGPLPPGSWTRPGALPRPTTSHGKAKYEATRAVLTAAEAGSLDASVLRIANIVGPGTPPVSLLGTVADQLANFPGGAGEARVELSPLVARRDYVDVRDVSGAVLVAAHRGTHGQVVDIGRGEAVPVRRMVEMLIRVSGVPARVVERPGRSPAADDWIRVDPGPARDVLGWTARRPLTRSVRDLWNTLVQGR